MAVDYQVVSEKRIGEEYIPKDLFPDWRDYSQRINDLHDYVEHRMIEMYKAGEFNLTDLFNQHPRVSEIAGMICLGQKYKPSVGEGHVQVSSPNFIPRELAHHEIRIRSLNGSNIKWSAGFLPVNNNNMTVGRVEAEATPLGEHKTNETGVTDGYFYISDAWLILKEHGKYCRKARTKEDQKSKWIYEEVIETKGNKEKKLKQ